MKAQTAIEYGQQLIDEKSAGPADLSIVAQAYLSVRRTHSKRPALSPTTHWVV
jgi:hypothetical protein